MSQDKDHMWERLKETPRQKAVRLLKEDRTELLKAAMARAKKIHWEDEIKTKW